MSIENLSKYEKETLRELTLLHFEIYFHSNYISLFFIKRFCKRVMNSAWQRDIVFIMFSWMTQISYSNIVKCNLYNLLP